MTAVSETFITYVPEFIFESHGFYGGMLFMRFLYNHFGCLSLQFFRILSPNRLETTQELQILLLKGHFAIK